MIHTIGHSNRSADAFVALLQQQAITQVIDVRRMPRSRFNPQFNEAALRALLSDYGIAYRHLPALGGKRVARADSINTALRTGGGFQGYADYMQTAAFASALQGLLDMAAIQRTVFMCAEREPSQCHRSLIADAIIVRGMTVVHIVQAAQIVMHAPHPRMQVNDGIPTYPAAPPRQGSLF